MRFTIVTLFPELVRPLFEVGVVGRAVTAGLLRVQFINPRDFTSDRHRTVDDSPYGGGPGMVMKVEPLVAAIESITDGESPPHRILMCPTGVPLRHGRVGELAELPHLVFVCGRYEGIDERVSELVIDEEISLGDFVLSGGEVGAMAVMDAVARHIPGVLGEKTSIDEESFSDGLLEYPQYTRPAEFRGLAIPEVLVGGNHSEIKKWRRRESLARTLVRRPDLLAACALGDQDNKVLDELLGGPLAARCYVALVHHPIVDKGNRVVTSSVTNLDLHDIARSASTYGLGGYFVVTPVTTQRVKVERILSTWNEQVGGDHRADALQLARPVSTVADAVAAVEVACGQRPLVIATSASSTHFPTRPRVDFAGLRRALCARGSAPRLILLGTGWGLAPELESLVDQVLTPIHGRPAFNHLSVRSAAAVLFDRIFGLRGE